MGVTLAGPRRARKWAESAQGSGNYACILLVKLRRTRLKRPIFDEIIGLTSKTDSVHTGSAKLYPRSHAPRGNAVLDALRPLDEQSFGPGPVGGGPAISLSHDPAPEPT
jgi:hypothetical protein